MRKWEFERNKSWGMPVEGFKGHVATDGSLLGNAGKWKACGWAVVQLDYDEVGPLHGMYGSMEAEYEVQRTVKSSGKLLDPSKCMSTTGIIHGLWRGERQCIDPKAGDAEFWENYGKSCTLEAHHTKKNKTDMSQFDKFVTDGNEKADELAKEGSLDEGFMAEMREEAVQQEREEVYAALQYAASFHCLVEEWKDCEELKPKPKER